ncbi:putative membrane protein [Synechococcus sp. CC9902]|uniref:DMT family transporter n=1 Tax=Synechococcus sp. (strain CC9902) TaxID=316279 RepID=UPI00005D4198|nr:DMT family transporter [Synechococcus sp. CC9902]ABB26260.1 putative membrane protein [Synechococcus sp. CC9902]
MPDHQTASPWWASEQAKGSRSLILSSLAFSLMTVCVKQLNGRIPVTEIVLVRAIVSLALTGMGLRLAGVKPWGTAKARGLLFARGIAGSIALLCFFQAIEKLPLAAATVLQYTYPTFTALAALFLLGESLRKRIVLAVLMGWVGITFVVQPDWLTGDVQALPLIPALIGILGALFTALAYVSVRRLSATEHPLVIILYFPLISVPITLPWVIGTGVWPMGMEWIWLLGIGVFTQLGQIWVTDGLRRLPAARATSINYIQVVFAASWGWLWFSESISLWQIGGGGLVLIATMISLSAKNNQPT